MSDILDKTNWSTKQLIAVILFAVTITFSATMIWARFLYLETNMSTISNRIEKKDNRINERVEKLEKRIEELELPNTD